MAQLGTALDETIKELAFQYLEAKKNERPFYVYDAIYFAMIGLENGLGEQVDTGGIKLKYALTFSRTIENVARVIKRLVDAMNVAHTETQNAFADDIEAVSEALEEICKRCNVTQFVLDRMGFNWDGTAWDIDWNEFHKLNEKYDNNTFSLHKHLLN